MIKVVKGEVKIEGHILEIMAETYVMIKGIKQFYHEKGLSDDRIIGIIEDAYTPKEGEVNFDKLGRALEEMFLL